MIDLDLIRLEPYIRHVIASWKFEPTPRFDVDLDRHPELQGVIIRVEVHYRGHDLEGHRLVSTTETRAAHNGAAYVRSQLDNMLDDLKLALDMLS